MDRQFRFGGYSVSHTDSHTGLVRFWVILSLTVSCIFIRFIALSGRVEMIYAQLFYFPVLYATYFYLMRGIFLTGLCAISYEVLAYVVLYPDTGVLVIPPARCGPLHLR